MFHNEITFFILFKRFNFTDKINATKFALFKNMKKIISLVILFLFQFVSAQENNQINIDWIDSGYSINENLSLNIPFFKNDIFSYDDTKRTIKYSKKIPVAGFIDQKSLKISNVVYEEIAIQKFSDLDLKSIPSSLNALIENSMARNENYGHLMLSPIINENGIYKRLKSFNYSFSYDYSNKINQNRAPNAIISSVLKTGVWKRFYVEKSGVYKISKSFLSEMGFDVNVNPQTIKIFGNGGRMIPLINSVPYPIDLAENAIEFVGEQDGVFNDGDYILFYAEGLDNYNAENDTHGNLYSDRSYYYVTSSAASGKRIAPFIESVQAPTVTYNTFDIYRYTETDRVNIARLGRKWYGQQFNVQNDQTFQFNFPNLVVANPILLNIKVAGIAVVPTSFSIKANNQSVGNVGIGPTGDNIIGYESPFSSTFTSSTADISISLNYNNGGVPSALGYLDYITLKGTSNLSGYGKQFPFTVDAVATNIGICEYQISNAAAISKIWDITDIYNVSSKINSGLSSIIFKQTMGQVAKFVAVDNSDFYTPLKDSDSNVNNQDLKGTIFKNNQGAFQDIDYIIVTPSFLYSQAERLANFHRTKSLLNVKVVTLESIYPEFSSGKQDIGAIRNFIKYVYDNASVPDKKIKYICLFGEGSFDFKNRIPKNSNVVPIFQSLSSLSLGTTLSDDYFVFMDPNEGNADSFSGSPDIAVGRILATNLSQAEKMVTKIFDYHDEKSYGKWRNSITMISDDPSTATGKGGDFQIQVDLDKLADIISAQQPIINVKKIHIDAYVQETTSGGQKYPKAREDFVNSFSQGSLMVNYFGHGGEEGLAQESIFLKSDALKLSNPYKYPVFVTVTCEFTRFDNPYRDSAGEFVYGNEFGGAVAMVTTTRQIGQSTGSQFNLELGKKLFPTTSNYVSIAEAVRQTKILQPSGVVSFLGDPAMKLAIPKPKVRLTKINDVPINAIVDPIKALSYAKLTGEVVDEMDNLLSNYNGSLAVNIYDKEIQRATLANDNFIYLGVPFILQFKTLGETIFRGNASIKNGQFEFGFIVPKDIKLPVGTGKVSFYAKQTGVLNDQTGSDFNIKIGGLNENAVADNVAPRIRLYMNDETFVFGGITNQSPLFLAFLEDENGINSASGIGHDIIAFLDGDETKPIVLNDFYETELDNYKNGKLKYQFKDLSVGLHTLTFKAWDVYNNLVTSELQFIVVGNETLTLSNVLNYPNPFVNHTEFWFSHNRPFEPLEVQVQVFTITGKVVWTKNETINTNGFLSRSITWDGRDDFGDRIGKGVYVYKLTVKSTLTDNKTEKFEKLVIL